MVASSYVFVALSRREMGLSLQPLQFSPPTSAVPFIASTWIIRKSKSAPGPGCDMSRSVGPLRIKARTAVSDKLGRMIVERAVNEARHPAGREPRVTRRVGGSRHWQP